MAEVECQALNWAHTQFVDIHFPGNEKKTINRSEKKIKIGRLFKAWCIIIFEMHIKIENTQYLFRVKNCKA